MCDLLSIFVNYLTAGKIEHHKQNNKKTSIILKIRQIFYVP